MKGITDKLENFAIVERVKAVQMLYKHIENSVDNNVKDQINDIKTSMVVSLSEKVDQNPFDEKNHLELKTLFDNQTQAKNLVPQNYSGFKLWGNENNASRIERSRDDNGVKCFDIYANENDSMSGALAERKYTLKEAAEYSDKFTKIVNGVPSNVFEIEKDTWKNINNESFIQKNNNNGKITYAVHGSFDNSVSGIKPTIKITLEDAAKHSNIFHRHKMLSNDKETVKEIER